VAQEIEIAGQRGRRIDAAQAEVEAVRATERRTSRLLAAEVHVVFVEAVEARELLEVARAESDLARQFLDLARRRLAAGEGTQLDVNVAAAELGRAEQAVGVEEGRYAAARAFLAETLGLQAATLPVPTGPLDPPMDEPPALDALLVDVEANRADLQALRETERAARGHVDRARAEAWPDLRLGLFSGVEEGRDALVGVSVALPLPVFARNQGAIAEAEAAVARVVAERDAARLSAVREVVVAWEQHRARARALTILRDRVLGTSEENLELLRKAFEAGKTGWVEVLVMRKALFDARRALLETSADLRRARVAIDIAAGRMPLPPGAGAR
jgi:cobalt-zinc-cadmium efflux system outer membrane protein